MNIEDLTIREAREIASLIGTQQHDRQTHPAIGRYAVVRTYSAGVHFGQVAGVSNSGKQVELANARRIWIWDGAFTLNEIATDGITGGKLSQQVSVIYLTEAIEIIPCSKDAERCLIQFSTHKP
jgi:hypothetical protein